MHLLIILLFLSGSLGAEEWTTWDRFFFHVSVTCGCTHQDSFYYSIKFFEHDNWLSRSPDDWVTDWFLKNKLKALGTDNKTFIGALNGDDDDNDDNGQYELYAYIEHNCIYQAKPNTIEVHFKQNYCKIKGGDCNVYVHIDLTGLETDESREARIEQK